MEVALCVGPRSNDVIRSVKAKLDNVNFNSFNNVNDFINLSQLQRLYFQRIVFGTKYIMNNDNPREEFQLLYQYLSKNSNSTIVIYVVSNKSDIDKAEIFKSIFIGPNYGVVYIPKPQTVNMSECCSKSVAELNAIYPIPGKGGNDKKKVAKSRKDKAKPGMAEEVGESGKTVEESSPQINFNDVTAMGSDNSGFMNIGNLSGDGNNNNFNLSNDGSSLYGNSQVQDNNFESNSLDDDLSLGDFGSKHSDSGLLDDDEEEEIRQLLISNGTNANEESGNNQDQYEDNYSEPDEEVVSEPAPIKKKKRKTGAEGIFTSGKINIITGPRGSGTTGYIVSVAKKMVSKGYSVVIVNLNPMCDIISFFNNIGDFYDNVGSDGINRLKIYSEDNIDVLSNGYYEKINISLERVFNQLRDYDFVLVDCPLENLKSFPDTLLNRSNIIVGCIADLSSLIETTNLIFNREYVSLAQEICICKNGKIANTHIKESDKEYIRNNFFFPNGCWI